MKVIHKPRPNRAPHRLIVRLFDYASCIELIVTRLALPAIFLEPTHAELLTMDMKQLKALAHADRRARSQVDQTKIDRGSIIATI